MSVPLLTVVIATKNRQVYCIEAIKSILSIPTEEIQIAIADNSDTKEIQEYLTMHPNDKIVYQYNNTPMSFVHNFNCAMELAGGEYICLIGDDDTVMPNILDTARWAKSQQIDSVCSTNTVAYYWPGANKSYPDGMLSLPLAKQPAKSIDAKAELKRLLRSGVVNYLLYPLPKTYHGLVKRDLMLEVKRRTGNFYGGLSPDIYSTIALSCLVKNHYIVSTPFSIAGACAKSATVESIAGKHCGELRDMPHLKNRGDYTWDSNVPEYYSVPTIWAESGLKALLDLGETELYKQFNAYTLITQGIIQNRKSILPIVLRENTNWRKRKRINSFSFYTHLFFELAGLTTQKIKRGFNNEVKVEIHPAVKDIQDAVNLIVKTGYIK